MCPDRAHRRGWAVARGLVAVALCVLVVGPASPAGADPSYVIAGTGDAPARTGAVAGEFSVQQVPGTVAVRNDGVIAFATGFDGQVFWVERGRLSRIRMPATQEITIGLAFAVDGMLLVSTCDRFRAVPSAVWRVSPGRQLQRVAGRPGRPGTSGDGGPAIQARLRCPVALDTQPDGGILIVDGAANRVRRVDPSGIIRTVAGTGREASEGDGGPAVRASVLAVDVTALAGGAFAIADLGPDARLADGVLISDRSVVRVVDAAGIITTRSRAGALAVAAEPGGALLTADPTDDHGLISRVDPDGRVSAVTDVVREVVGISGEIPIAGDPFGSDLAELYDVAVSPDGGVVFTGTSTNSAVHYVPPPSPSLLAVGILPATRLPRRALQVAVRTTLPARIHVGVWARGRRVASATALAPGGDAFVPVARRLTPGLYSVRVRAEGTGQVAAARADVLIGGRLPVPYVRAFIRSRQDLFRVFDGAPRATLDCRRIARRRVDCGIVQRRRCTAVATVRVQADGTLAVAQYDGGRRRRCRLRR